MSSFTLRPSFDELIAGLKSGGYNFVEQEGIHQKWQHQYSGKQIIIPYNKAEKIRPKLLQCILDGAGHESKSGGVIFEFLSNLLLYS